MNITLKITAFSVAFLTLNASSAFAISFDANVTPEVIYGSGNANGSWTVDQSNGIELGLRAKVRLPTPLNVFNSDGAGNYLFPTYVNAPFSKVNWNYDFSINSDYANGSTKLNAYEYWLAIDLDPTQGKAFSVVDPMAFWSDNALGNNSTANGGGIKSTSYSLYNVAQNSQNLGWLGADGSKDATYDFVLFATAQGTGSDSTKLAQTSMRVIVGNGGAAVPEGGSSFTLLGLAGLVLGSLKRGLRK